MARPSDNPFVPAEAFLGMHPGDPARETPKLTVVQSFALPVLLWFMDSSRNRGQGRSVLAAHVAIELARRGYVVNLADGDPSCSFMNTLRPHDQQRFAELVLRVAHDDYPRDNFQFRQDRWEFSYKGRRPK